MVRRGDFIQVAIGGSGGGGDTGEHNSALLAAVISTAMFVSNVAYNHIACLSEAFKLVLYLYSNATQLRQVLTTLNYIPGMLYSAAVALLGRDHGARVGVDGTED